MEKFIFFPRLLPDLGSWERVKVKVSLQFVLWQYCMTFVSVCVNFLGVDMSWYSPVGKTSSVVAETES